MKNTFKLFSIIAMLAVIALSMTACGDPGDDGVPKKIEITGIPTSGTNSLMGKTITVGIADSKNGKAAVYAVGQGTVSNSTFLISLVSNASSKKGEPYTGTGLVYIYIFVDVNNPDSLNDDDTYVYKDGDDTGGTKYDIQDAKSSIPWSKFIKVQ